MSDDLYREPRHPIRVVADRTGVGVETLRAWERRYGAVRPERTPGGQRLYSDADVERLRQLARLVEGGRSIGQVAELDPERLSLLLHEDTPDGEGAGAAGEDAEHGRRVLEAARSAVLSLDGPRLEAVLRQGVLQAGARRFVGLVAVPLLRWLGTGWESGELSVAHEHLASVVLRRVLGSTVDTGAAAPGAPVLVCATPAGQVHEFGALLAAVVAASLEWRVVYLGADLPADDIASAVRTTRASVVGLSVVYPPDDPRLPTELRRLRAALPEGVRVLIGGAGALRIDPLLAELGMQRAAGLAELERALAAARAMDPST
jgi:MerR family transcriptional regulator, light-induced transcriptional regulator